MPVKTTEQLKSAFSAGKIASASDFSDLIDTFAGGSDISTFLSSTNMFSSSKPVGAIEVFVNTDSTSTTLSVPTGGQEDETFNVPEYGSVAFVKVNDSPNHWSPIALPIQQGGADGDVHGNGD